MSRNVVSDIFEKYQDKIHDDTVATHENSMQLV